MFGGVGFGGGGGGSKNWNYIGWKSGHILG